jgi:hypothetical protein
MVVVPLLRCDGQESSVPNTGVSTFEVEQEGGRREHENSSKGRCISKVTPTQKTQTQVPPYWPKLPGLLGALGDFPCRANKV